MGNWNNYGLRTRDIRAAGRIALNQQAARGQLSFTGTDSVAQRWNHFTGWAYFHEKYKTKWMESITRVQVIEYGKSLADSVDAGEIATSTAQDYVSAVNTVMKAATHDRWQSVGPVTECGIPNRSTIRKVAPGAIDRRTYNQALAEVAEVAGERAAAVARICRELGLRSKESSLIDAKTAANQAHQTNVVSVTDGTKGGRPRNVPITSYLQIEALELAAKVQGNDRSMIPADQTWRKWREGRLRAAREIFNEHTGGGLHDLRTSYACDRYRQLTGRDAPVVSGQVEDRNLDREAREAISAELGHGRIDVVSAYVGGRS